MSNAFDLEIRQEFGKQKAKKLRKDSMIPGVIYGDKIKNRHFTIDAREIDKMKNQSKQGTGLIDVNLKGESESVKAVVQNIQQNPVSSKYEHIDLYQVRMDKKLHTDLSLEFMGQSKAVEDLGGILVKQYDKIAIECLPKDLISHLQVPIDCLNTFEDVIRVKDLNLPKGIETSVDKEEIVAAVNEPRSEKELEELESEVKSDVEGIEVAGEKKEDAEEGADDADKTADSDDKKESSEEQADKDSKDKDKSAKDEKK